MEIKKNDYFEIDIIDIGSNGEGIGKINNFTIFVDGALPQEKVSIKIIKVNTKYAFGKLLKIIEKSPFREIPKCEYYGLCGGCSLMHLSYDKQLEMKTQQIQNNLKKIANITDIEVPKTIGMDNPFYYRNKASFPINYTNSLNIGFYRMRTHNIVNIKSCIIQNPINDKIIQKMREFIQESNISTYDEHKKRGELKHIVTRVNKQNELLLCIVVNNNSFKYKEKLLQIMSSIDEIKTIVINYNTRDNNVILGNKTEIIFGKGYIVDTIKGLKFNISALSFYQVNSFQVEVLYNIALEFAGLKGDENIIDAYCGIGTISLFLAQKSQKVYGIEIISEAVQNAKINAEINAIENVEFLTGKAEEIIPKLVFEKQIIPDLLVVDPPRKGCEIELLDAVVKADIKKIVYISCNNTTLARDINYLKEFGFEIKKIKAVDMFCMSTHVETVVLLTR